MFTSNLAAQIGADEIDDSAEEAAERASLLRTSILLQREYRKNRYVSGRCIRHRADDLDDIDET